MKLNLTNKRKLTKKINGQEFTVEQYIPVQIKKFIISKLLEYYRDIKEKNLEDIVCDIRANLDVMVLAFATNIETDENTKYEDLLDSGLIDIVRKSIYNYEELYQDATYVILMDRMSFTLPDIGEAIKSIPDELEKMSPEQKNMLEIIAKASLANSANTSIMNIVKGDN